MIQITPQMRVVAAIEPADFRRGIDGLARLCKDVLKHDPFNGWVFVFRNRSATAIKILVYVGLYFAVGDKNTTIRRLRQMLFGIKTEKTAAVVGDRKDSQPLPLEAATASTTVTPDGETETVSALTMDEGKLAETPRKGHGRNGVDAYTAAEKIEVRHDSLQPGDPCPQCEKGTVYETNRPGVLVRLVGQVPVGAKVYYLQKLRCNLCGVALGGAIS
jgi:hypothetical protein